MLSKIQKGIVKIILIATDTKKKSLVFVDENLKVYSLQMNSII